jgi:hypothetical protein
MTAQSAIVCFILIYYLLLVLVECCGIVDKLGAFVIFPFIYKACLSPKFCGKGVFLAWTSLWRICA